MAEERQCSICGACAYDICRGFAGIFSAKSASVRKSKTNRSVGYQSSALIDNKGKAAFENFRKKDSEWFHGDTYLFVYDMNANVLLNPAFPKREGTNVSGQKDTKGKLCHNEIMKTAETKGSGWVDYMFPKPGQTEPSQKWTFVKKVTIDGAPGLVRLRLLSRIVIETRLGQIPAETKILISE